MSSSPERSRARPWVAAALLLLAPIARAAHPLPWAGAPFTADPSMLASAAASLETPPGGGRDVLLDSVRARIDERGAVTTVRHVVYRVAAPEADPGAARIEVAWAPAVQARPRIRARVVTAGGSVRELDAAALAEGAAPSPGRMLLAGALPGIAPGAVVELEITLHDRAAAAGAVGGLRLALAGAYPARWSRVEVLAPASLPLRWRVRGTQARARQSTAGGTHRLVVEQRGVAAAPAPEASRPRELPGGPELIVAWGGSWRRVAERAGAAFTLRSSTPAVEAAARGAAGEARGREEVARRLAAWMRKGVQRTGVPLAESGLAPVAPAETLRRRQGDGEDLALLLVALLRARGLEARPVLARAAWDEIVPDLPGLGGFDQVLVRVEGDPPIWIDPSDPEAPPGRLPAALQGRLALPLGPGVPGLVRTPSTAASQNRVRVERALLPARLGRGAVVETRELAGAPADAERTLRRALSAEDRDELDQRHAREVLRGNDLVYASVEGGEEVGGPLRIRMEVRGSEAVLTGEEGASLPVPMDQVFELLPPALTGGERPAAEPLPPRRGALLLAYPFQAELVYRVVPPDGYRVGALPAGSEERFGPVRLRARFSIGAGGEGVARYLLECERSRLTAAQADALARRIRAARGDRGPVLRVERISAVLFREGRVAEALAELRAVSARHPEDVVAAGQLALGLLRMGFTGAAEAEMRRALELQPASGWGHRVLGLVLEHDELGRYQGPGFRRMAAVAAYGRARQLEPGNPATRARLAELLASDGAGRAALDRRAAALAEYEALARDLGDHGRDPARLELLLDLGRLDEAIALARQVPAGGLRDAVLLAATAARDGVPDALREARPLGERAQALRQASGLLLRAGRPAAAAELARAARGAAPEAPGISEHAEALTRLEAWERSRAPGDEGEWIIRRLLHTAAVASDPVAEVAPLLAPWLGEADAERVSRSLAAPFSPLRRSAAEQGLPPAVLADLLLSGVELDRDGDAAGGERLRLRLGPPPGAPLLTVFLAPAGASQRIVATDSTWLVLAAQADSCAAAGDLAGARRWLSFARDALGKPADEAGPPSVLAALESSGADAGGAETRRATLALLAFGDAEARTVPALVAARREAPAGQRRALGFALAAAYRAAGRWSDLEAIAAELAAEQPGARATGGLRALALARLGRIGELRAAAAQALAGPADDPEIAAALAGAQLTAGDLEGSLATHRRLIGSGKAGPLVYNDAAWLELFQDTPGPETLAWARRATASSGAGHAALNTLAAVSGLLGRAAEARDALVRSLEAAGGKAPEPADWLAQATVAEACGLPALAREAYARVTPEPDDPSAPYLLARRRLAALDAPRPPAPPPSELAPPPPSGPETPPAPPPAKDGPRKHEPQRPPARAKPA